MPSQRTVSRAPVVAALAIVCAASAGCARGGPPPGAPNVLLITLDTLRADHLGCYGYARPTSPRIDEFSRRATRYERAVSTAPWTVPSHASLFTGLHPFQHGAHDFEVDREVNNVNPLAEEHVTLAEVLKQEGYATAAFVANDVYLNESYQLDQGFETYDVERRRAPGMNRKVFRWLERHGRRPFFLFVNYMDTHRPYNTSHAPGSLLPPPPAGESGELLDQLRNIVMASDAPAPEELVARIVAQYDAGVANVDAGVGELLDRLSALGIYDGTIVLLTSDHGEYFGEHRLVEHSKDIYEEAVSIPLIVKHAGQTAGQTVSTPVSLVDGPRLILDGIGPVIAARGASRFPYAPGHHPLLCESWFARPHDLFGHPWAGRFNRVRTAIYDDRWKYIRSSDDKDELFDLASDPRESVNLVSRERETTSRLRQRIEAIQAEGPRFTSPDDARPLSEEEIAKMKALGYL